MSLLLPKNKTEISTGSNVQSIKVALTTICDEVLSTEISQEVWWIDNGAT